MAEEFIEIHWTTGSLDEARRVSRYLVQERIVACAQIVPWIESIYIWDNDLQTTQESKVVFKTRAESFGAVEEVIKKNSSYDVPEIIQVAIVGGNSEYLDWMTETTTVVLAK